MKKIIQTINSPVFAKNTSYKSSITKTLLKQVWKQKTKSKQKQSRKLFYQKKSKKQHLKKKSRPQTAFQKRKKYYKKGQGFYNIETTAKKENPKISLKNALIKANQQINYEAQQAQESIEYLFNSGGGTTSSSKIQKKKPSLQKQQMIGKKKKQYKLPHHRGLRRQRKQRRSHSHKRKRGGGDREGNKVGNKLKLNDICNEGTQQHTQQQIEEILGVDACISKQDFKKQYYFQNERLKKKFVFKEDDEQQIQQKQQQQTSQDQQGQVKQYNRIKSAKSAKSVASLYRQQILHALSRNSNNNNLFNKTSPKIKKQQQKYQQHLKQKKIIYKPLTGKKFQKQEINQFQGKTLQIQQDRPSTSQSPQPPHLGLAKYSQNPYFLNKSFEHVKTKYLNSLINNRDILKNHQSSKSKEFIKVIQAFLSERKSQIFQELKFKDKAMWNPFLPELNSIESAIKQLESFYKSSKPIK